MSTCFWMARKYHQQDSQWQLPKQNTSSTLVLNVKCTSLITCIWKFSPSKWLPYIHKFPCLWPTIPSCVQWSCHDSFTRSREKTTYRDGFWSWRTLFKMSSIFRYTYLPWYANFHELFTKGLPYLSREYCQAYAKFMHSSSRIPSTSKIIPKKNMALGYSSHKHRSGKSVPANMNFPLI